MTLIGIISTPRLASVEAPGFNLNPSVRLSRPTCLFLIGKNANSTRIQSSNFRCSLSRETLSPLQSEENDNLTASDRGEEEFGHVMKFKISDFKICDRVSSGPGGRYHDSFSLRHWLQQSDWLPTLEATRALDEESVRRVGDDTVGGPGVPQQLHIIRVNYLHSHGLAHMELRLENLHISPLDRHIKVGILENAADFSDNSLNNSTLDNDTHMRQMMIAFDMRCVGFIMTKMVLRELMEPLIFSKFKAFLTQCREMILPVCMNSYCKLSIGHPHLEMLDYKCLIGVGVLDGTFYPYYLQANLLRELGA